MKDTFDLTKFLKENKSLENLNPTFKSLNENKHVKDKIKEMILAELGNSDDDDDEEDTRIDYSMGQTGDNQMPKPPKYINLDIEEAKKDKEVEDVETTDVETTDTTEEVPAEDTPAEETPATGGGLEDIAADMEGTEGDLMDHLMKALKVAKGMNNEKLETQIGNTLKFFVSEYIGGEEQ
jgi:hypothetical protein